MLDLNKKGRAQKGKKTDELVREENLGLEARQAMRRFALSFLRSSFNRESLCCVSCCARKNCADDN